VLVAVGTAYVDSSKADVNSLFQQGVQELRYDFDEDAFLQEIPPRCALGVPCPLQEDLGRVANSQVKSRTDAHQEVQDLVQAARRADLDVKPALAVAIGLEFAFRGVQCAGRVHPLPYPRLLQLRQHRRRSRRLGRRPTGRDPASVSEKPGRGGRPGSGQPHRPHRPRRQPFRRKWLPNGSAARRDRSLKSNISRPAR